jgi:hypothetical protein
MNLLSKSHVYSTYQFRNVNLKKIETIFFNPKFY